MSITTTELQQQYIAYFGRPGDPEGLAYWTSDATDIKTAADFAEKIYAQPEYQTTTIASKTTSEQVNQLYVNLFNRSADAAGLLYWTTEIEKGSLSLSNLAYDLIYAAANPLADNAGQAAQDAANLSAKVSAAEAYTATVASNASALMAYQPGAAYDSAVSFISAVSFNTQVNQPVITTAAGLAPLNAQSVTTFVGQMLGSQSAVDAASTAADAATANAEAVAASQAAQLQVAQLQAAQAEAAAAQATLANQQAITAAAAEATAAAEAVANAPQTLILATTLDNLSGGSQDDLFNGAAGTIDSDILDGGDGNDTLKVTLAAADSGSTFQSTSIENLKFRTTGAATIDLGDALGVTGTITGERLAAGANLTLTDVQAIPTTVALDRNSANADLTVTFDGSATEATTDVLAVNISNSSNAGTVTVDGIETINLVSTDDPSGLARNELQIDAAGTSSATEVLNISGAGDLTVTATDALTVNNSSSATVTVNPTAATTITHTGSGSLTVGTANLTRTVTASGTGALTFTSGTGVETVTGSTGNDRFVMNGNLVSTDTVAGGDGTDTLQVLGAADTLGAAVLTLVSGIETIELDTQTTGDILDFADLSTPADITTVNVDIIDNGVVLTNNAQVTLTDTQASTFGFSIPATTADAVTLAAATIDLLDSSATTDAITINLTNAQTAAGVAANTNAMSITTLTADGIETISFNADSVSSTGVEDDITIGTLASSTISTINISGDADFTITNAIDTDIDTINASAATDAVNTTVAGSNVTYTGGSGVDTISFGTSLTAADSVDGGGGTDVLNATFSSGTVSPANITSVETFNGTFSGGALNASNLGDITTLNVTATAPAVISGIQGTTSTINQVSTTSSPAVNFQYAAGAAATATWKNTQTAAVAITNSATTFNNVANLTVNGDNGIAGNSAITLGSLNGGSVLNSLTILGSTDATEGTFNTGNISGVNLETLTVTADATALTLGTFASANELKTLTINNVDVQSSGILTIGDIGVTSAADELTSFSLVTSGDSTGASTDVRMGELDAARATTGTAIDTFNINLGGNYGSSTIGQVDAHDIAGITITTSTNGTSLTSGGFNLNGSVTGDITITAGDDFDGSTDLVQTNEGDANGDDYIVTEANGSVGNISLTSTGSMSIAEGHADNSFINVATTVGNIAFDTKASTSSIGVGAIEDATTVGNITFTGLGTTNWDAAPAATTIGNVSGSVAAGERMTIGTAAGQVLGAAGGVMGSTTVTGAGDFQMIVGPVTTLGNIDLSGMNASTSSSQIQLSGTTTPVGVIYTGSAGTDIFAGTAGSDVIDPGLGSDTIFTDGANDNVTITETVNSPDTVIRIVAALGTSDIDTITGFVTGNGGDIIGFDTDGANAIGAGGFIARSGLDLATDGTPVPVLIDVAKAATSTSAGNIIKVTYDADVDAITDVTPTITLNAGSHATDLMPIIWYDDDGGFMEVGISNANQALGDTSFVFASGTYTPLARVPMTSGRYTATTAENFDFYSINAAE